MNNIAYVPVRKGETRDWFDWSCASGLMEQAEHKAKCDDARYPAVGKAWPVLRIAKVEVKEVKHDD